MPGWVRTVLRRNALRLLISDVIDVARATMGDTVQIIGQNWFTVGLTAATGG